MNDEDFPQILCMNHSNSSTPSTAIHNGCRTGLAVGSSDASRIAKRKKNYSGVLF